MRSAILLLLFAACAIAQQDWRPLFDGKTTTGWRGMMGDPFPGDCWAVEDGMLRTKLCRGQRDIVTVEEFGDFEVEWEWRIPPGGNTGLKYLVREGELHPWQKDQRRPYGWAAGLLFLAAALVLRRSVAAAGLLLAVMTVCLFFYREYTWQGLRASTSPEFQMLDDARNGDARNGVSYQTGSLYALLPAHGRTMLPAGEWNESRVIVRGRRVEHWLNGARVLEYDLDGAALRENFAKSKYHYIEVFLRPGRGRIALQHHGDVVWFRGLKIRSV